MQPTIDCSASFPRILGPCRKLRMQIIVQEVPALPSGVRRGALSGGQDGIKCMQDYAAAVGHEVQMRVSLVELNEAYGFCATGGGKIGAGRRERALVRDSARWFYLDLDWDVDQFVKTLDTGSCVSLNVKRSDGPLRQRMRSSTKLASRTILLEQRFENITAIEQGNRGLSAPS